MKTEQNRVYGIKDAHMLETARTLHSLFNDHIADFTAFDTSLDTAFATSWLATIDAAATVVRDSQIKDIQAAKTETVLEKMELCRIKYNQIKYFAGRAFSKNKIKLAEFGAEDYEKVRKSQALMISFMDEMHKACITYSTELEAAGLAVGEIAEIETLKIELQDANTIQENYMRARPVLTEERIAILNQCFETTMIVVNAAQVLYYNEYALRRMFVFSPTGGSKGNGGDSADSEIVSLVVDNNNLAVEVFSIAYEPSRQIIVKNNGPAEVEMFVSDDPNDMGSPMVVGSGNNMTFTIDQLGPHGNSIFAKAINGTGPEANIEVEISLEL